jgi:hypothetical protein
MVNSVTRALSRHAVENNSLKSAVAQHVKENSILKERLSQRAELLRPRPITGT